MFVVRAGATTVYMTQSIMPQNANTLGITFGGQVGKHVLPPALCSSSLSSVKASVTGVARWWEGVLLA
jgi:acyl-CoA hydrolase